MLIIKEVQERRQCINGKKHTHTQQIYYVVSLFRVLSNVMCSDSSVSRRGNSRCEGF